MNEDPFLLVLEAEGILAFVPVVIAHGSTIKGAAQDYGNCGWCPLVSPPGAMPGIVQGSCGFHQGMLLQVDILQEKCNLFLIISERKGICLFIIVVGVGDSAAVPFAVCGPGVHRGRYTFTGHVALQLRED